MDQMYVLVFEDRNILKIALHWSSQHMVVGSPEILANTCYYQICCIICKEMPLCGQTP